jgi:lipid-A-disaccharide synthase
MKKKISTCTIKSAIRNQKSEIKVFIIAGEVSGDNLGSRIMREMKGVKFVGIGGENMKAAGLSTVFPINDLAVLGPTDALASAHKILRRVNQTRDAIIAEKPDIILSIDAPGFVRRVIKKVKGKTDAKFYHVVAPQVWAWGAHRAKKYAKIFDRLYAFFDFEVPYFTPYGLPTIPVGHPIAAGLCPQKEERRKKKKEKIIALMPGSRMGEVKKLLPIYKDVIAGLPEYKFVLPVVETTEKYVRENIKSWHSKPEIIPSSKRYELYAKTDTAVAAVGTVSAELAIMHVPTIAIYKMHPVSTFLARRLIKLRYLSLVNILLNKSVYPELLGGDATAKNVIAEIKKLDNPTVRKKMISDLKLADKMWQRDVPAAKLIADDIQNQF